MLLLTQSFSLMLYKTTPVTVSAQLLQTAMVLGWHRGAGEGLPLHHLFRGGLVMVFSFFFSSLTPTLAFKSCLLIYDHGIKHGK